jgi:cytochrome c biogenesis protein CcmG/thiol:disulfide interchange protein DsbE
MNRYLSALMILLSLVVVLYAREDQTTGKRAPDFTLKDPEGNHYKLSDHFGKGPILLNFWATWCVPCIEELKQMKRIYKKYSDKGVEFLAISVDDPKTVGRVNSFVKSHHYPFKILLDTNSEVMHLYQSKVPPFTVLINYSGMIVYSHLGYRMGDEKEIETQLKNLLKNKPTQ